MPARHFARRGLRDRLWHARSTAVRVRPAGDAGLRLEGPDHEERYLRRPDLHQVHDVAGAGQRYLLETRGRL
jgi:hypothetical protein